MGLWDGSADGGQAKPGPDDLLPAADWARANRPVLRLALIYGSSAQLTGIIVAALLNRPEWALWGAATAGNLWGAGILLYRWVVRRRLLSHALAEA